MKRKGSFLCVALLLVACVSESVATATVAGTVTSEETIAAPTHWLTETVTNAAVLMPEWVGDANIQVLLSAYGNLEDSNFYLVLHNALTGENVELPDDWAQATGFFWLPDGTGFGLVTTSRQLILADNTGSIREFVISDSIDLDDLQGELEASGSDPNDLAFQLYENRAYLSPDGSRFINSEYTNNHEGQLLYIAEVGNRNSKIVGNAESWPVTYFGDWSPSGELFSVSQYSRFLDSGDLFSSKPDFVQFGIGLIEADSGEYFHFIENMREPSFSSDGFKVVMSNWVAEYRLESPCIYSVETGNLTCFSLDQILLGTNSANQSLTGVSGYVWRPGSDQITFIYEYQEPYPNWSFRRGLCLFGIVDLQTLCILKDMQVEDLEPLFYEFSPDGEYVFFNASNTSMGSDDSGLTVTGSASISTGEFYLIRGLPELGWNISIWRPPLH